MPHELAEPFDEVLEVVGSGSERHRLAQRSIRVGEVAQHTPSARASLKCATNSPKFIARS